jgi:predicted ester cyclase
VSSSAFIAALRSGAREIYSNDFVAHDWRGDNTGGLAAFPQSIADGRADYPDWTEKVESMVAEGDFVAVRFLSTGTQGRDLAAVPHVMPVIPHKHRFVRFSEIEVFRISDEKLAEQWDISDGWDAKYSERLVRPRSLARIGMRNRPEEVTGCITRFVLGTMVQTDFTQNRVKSAMGECFANDEQVVQFLSCRQLLPLSQLWKGCRDTTRVCTTQFSS